MCELSQRADLGRRTHGDHFAAAGAALGTQIDDPVGFVDDVEVVLDGDDGVAAIDEAVQHVDEALDVGEVEAGGRLVEHVERARRATPCRARRPA